MSWNEEKGFGFILLQGGSKESIYVHRTGLYGIDTLREGDSVEFERTQDARDVERGKERAFNVRLCTSSAGGHSGSRGGFDGERNAPVQNPFHRSAPREDRGYGASDRDSHGGHSDRRFGYKGPAEGYETGTVTSWNDEKGFGFIMRDGSSESIYVHRTGLIGIETLREGDAVEYGRTQDARDVERGKDRAVNVRILSSGRGRERSRSPHHHLR